VSLDRVPWHRVEKVEIKDWHGKPGYHVVIVIVAGDDGNLVKQREWLLFPVGSVMVVQEHEL